MTQKTCPYYIDIIDYDVFKGDNLISENKSKKFSETLLYFYFFHV